MPTDNAITIFHNVAFYLCVFTIVDIVAVLGSHRDEMSLLSLLFKLESNKILHPHSFVQVDGFDNDAHVI